MIHRLWRFFLKALSYSPILAVTDDNNFGTNETKPNAAIRLSLINLYLGRYAVYFCTFLFWKKRFRLFDLISLENAGTNGKDREIDDCVKRYKETHLKDLKDEDLLVEEDYLKYLGEKEAKRIEKSETKISIYSTVVLFIIPIVLVFFDIKAICSYQWYELIVLGFILYCCLNIVLLLFSSIKVSGIRLSSFKDLRASNDKKKKAVESYYFDWQSRKNKADIAVSYVINIEGWIKKTIVFLLIIVIMTNVRTLIDVNKGTVDVILSDQIITISTDTIEDAFSENYIKLSEEKLKLSKKEIKGITLIVSDKDVVGKISPFFADYNDMVSICYCMDNSLPKSTVKMIEE